MKTLCNTNYYTKVEAAALIGVSIGTLNARILAAHVDGYRFGRYKYYTEEQVKTLAEYKPTH